MKNKLRAFVIMMSFCIASNAFAAGIPVFDGANATQTTISAMENVAQTLKQLEQYTLQLQQYQKQIDDMLLNNVAPAAYIWNEASSVMSKMNALQQKLYSSGSIDAYLSKYKDINFYRNNPYATPEQMKSRYTELEEMERQSQENLARTIVHQQDEWKAGANRLEMLQQNATTAKGRLEALQYANQLAAMQNEQLLELRALLAAQAARENTQAQIDSDRRAQGRAVLEKILENNVTRGKSPY